MEYLLNTIDIELSAHCNFLCEFCPYPDITRPKGQMDFSLVTQILDEIAEKRICKNIGISQMGEPLLYKKLPEVIEYAKKRDLEVHVITNGSLLDEKKAEAIFYNGLDKLLISYHTPEEKSFNNLRGDSNISFSEYEDRIFRTIRLKLEKKYSTEVIMNFMFSGDVPFKIPRCIDTFEDLEKAMKKWIIKINKLGSWINEQRLENFMKDLKNNIDYYNYFEVTPGIKFSVGLVYRWANWLLIKQGIRIKPNRRGYCTMPFERIMILWNGDVTFCCGDYDGKLVIGNVKELPLSEIYEERLLQVRNEFKEGTLSNEFCQQCRGKIRLFSLPRALDYGHILRNMILNPSIINLFLKRLKKRTFLIRS